MTRQDAVKQILHAFINRWVFQCYCCCCWLLLFVVLIFRLLLRVLLLLHMLFRLLLRLLLLLLPMLFSAFDCRSFRVLSAFWGIYTRNVDDLRSPLHAQAHRPLISALLRDSYTTVSAFDPHFSPPGILSTTRYQVHSALPCVTLTLTPSQP